MWEPFGARTMLLGCAETYTFRSVAPAQFEEKPSAASEKGKRVLPMLAEPFGAVSSLIERRIVEFHSRSLGVSSWVGITGPHPIVPQEDESPCSACCAGRKGEGGRKADRCYDSEHGSFSFR
jgi:hypothetical protein